MYFATPAPAEPPALSITTTVAPTAAIASTTPKGEGKTTVSVGLSDGINKIGKKSIVCLREKICVIK